MLKLAQKSGTITTGGTAQPLTTTSGPGFAVELFNPTGAAASLFAGDNLDQLREIIPGGSWPIGGSEVNPIDLTSIYVLSADAITYVFSFLIRV